MVVWEVRGWFWGWGRREERGETCSCVVLDAFGYDGVDCLLAFLGHGGGWKSVVMLYLFCGE